MTDNWDDSDDDWDADESELDARLGLTKKEEQQATFDDEEDLAVKEKELSDKLSQVELKKKGNALAEKKAAEKARKEEEELARKAMELEAEMEENMTVEERRALEKRRVEEADNELTDDLFGGVDAPRAGSVTTGGGGEGTAMNAGDTVKMKDLKDHLKHARKVGQCIKAHGKTHLATAFLKEAIQECKDVLDDNAISELIKTCNVIKNEKVAAAKRKVKGQATKGAKRDKAAEQKAKKLQVELYGDSNQYDKYDEYGESYEDDFF